MDAFASIPPPFPMPCEKPMDLDDEQGDQRDSFKEPSSEKDQSCLKENDGSRVQENKGDWDGESLSDMSDGNNGLPPKELFALASSSKNEGSRLYSENKIDEACAAYMDGIKKMKDVTSVPDVPQESVTHLKVALYLNCSLCHHQLSQWPQAIKASSEALALDPSNVKGLFRRGVARSREGFLVEARSDLLRVCQLCPTDAKARAELKLVNAKLTDARNRDKKAFSGLFMRSGGLYGDREKEMEERKKRQAEELARDQEEFNQENKRREANGESPLEHFESWRQDRSEAQKAKSSESPAQAPPKPSKNSSSAVDAEELDEEDRKIMEETKKMGYCYFNRPVNPEVKTTYAEKTKPIRVNESSSETLKGTSATGKETESSKCSLSSWNNKGTTYEEKDCSAWVCKTLRECLSKVSVSRDQSLNMENLSETIAKINSAVVSGNAKSSVELQESLAKAFPFSCVVNSVDTVEGDAQIVVLRSSKRYLYDMKIVLSFTVTIPDSLNPSKEPTNYMGTIHLEDVSSTSSTRSISTDPTGGTQVDWLHDAKVTLKDPRSLPALHQPVWNAAIKVLKKAIHDGVKRFDDMFHEYA